MKTKITKKQFLADVMHEIDSLKANATASEISKLNMDDFDPLKPSSCIYGQLTGNCTSSRARNLMDLSCIRTFSCSDSGVNDLDNKSFTAIKSHINGVYDGKTWSGKSGGWRDYKYLSALEGYITLADPNISGIMAYLKGEVSTLKL